jgi:hypothetical protein
VFRCINGLEVFLAKYGSTDLGLGLWLGLGIGLEIYLGLGLGLELYLGLGLG